jgi:hypothetical protein
MLKWLSINKDAMIALAALVSPLIAILGGLVSSVVSYRAVVTGPRIQREIADRQFRLTSSQMTASLFGAADHKWIDDFGKQQMPTEPLMAARQRAWRDRDIAGSSA